MSVYIDANILVALFIPDALSKRAAELVGALSDTILISDFAALEVSSTLARTVRAREMTEAAARGALANFDGWSQSHTWLETQAADIAAASAYTRRFNINLHAADALHVAMAARANARLLTLDAKMKASAKKAGLAVV